MAVLEAMSHNTPCLLSSACNIRSAFTSGAAIKAEPDPLKLSIALKNLFSMNDYELGVMSLAAHNLVRENFSWDTVTSLCSDVYEWMLDRSRPRPRAFNWIEDISNL